MYKRKIRSASFWFIMNEWRDFLGSPAFVYISGETGMKINRARWIQGGILLLVIAAIVFISKFGKFDDVMGHQRYTVTYMDAFDTVTQIIGYDVSEEAFLQKAELLHGEMLRYHRLFDIYNNYTEVNNLKTINDMAGKGPVEVSDEILELLNLGKEVYGITNGQTNVAMGSVLKVWHNYRQEGINAPKDAKVPDEAILQAQAEFINPEWVLIDEEAKTVELTKAEMSLDVGSLAKGYVADKLAEYATELGMESLLISIGGNIVAVGTKADGEAWNVGIQKPRYIETEDDTQYADSVQIADASVVTSGDYQRYYEVNGVRYCHIIDPDTLMPGEMFSSVTIIGDSSAMADALSTALFNMTLAEGQALLENLQGYEAMWITVEGEIIYTDGFK